MKKFHETKLGTDNWGSNRVYPLFLFPLSQIPFLGKVQANRIQAKPKNKMINLPPHLNLFNFASSKL